MKLLKEYFELQKKIYDYFGYVENWVVIPLEDSTEYYWCLSADESEVIFSEKVEELSDGEGNNYSNGIYYQRFLNKWVYRGKDFTMLVVDTHTDGNKFLQVFDNNKEVKEIN